jgi:hypothetical protein
MRTNPFKLLYDDPNRALHILDQFMYTFHPNYNVRFQVITENTRINEIRQDNTPYRFILMTIYRGNFNYYNPSDRSDMYEILKEIKYYIPKFNEIIRIVDTYSYLTINGWDYIWEREHRGGYIPVCDIM